MSKNPINIFTLNGKRPVDKQFTADEVLKAILKLPYEKTTEVLEGMKLVPDIFFSNSSYSHSTDDLVTSILWNALKLYLKSPFSYHFYTGIGATVTPEELTTWRNPQESIKRLHKAYDIEAMGSIAIDPGSLALQQAKSLTMQQASDVFIKIFKQLNPEQQELGLAYISYSAKSGAGENNGTGYIIDQAKIMYPRVKKLIEKLFTSEVEEIDTLVQLFFPQVISKLVIGYLDILQEKIDYVFHNRKGNNSSICYTHDKYLGSPELYESFINESLKMPYTEWVYSSLGELTPVVEVSGSDSSL